MGLFRWKGSSETSGWQCCDSISCFAGLLSIIFVVIGIVNLTTPDEFEDAIVDQCLYVRSTYEECTVEDDTPNQQLFCPAQTVQVGEFNADISGCGLTSCNDRYKFSNIKQCKKHCEKYQNSSCKSFSWSPIGGDQNHKNTTVCTLYNTDVSTGQWGPNQVLCRLNTLQCPEQTIQVGGINSNIEGCGLTDCEHRYNFSSIHHCEEHCWRNSNCSSFNWAPVGGDKNHSDTTVCTIYDTSDATEVLSSNYNQILCEIETEEAECNSTIGRHYFETKNKTCETLYDETACSCDKPKSSFSGWRTCYILQCTDGEWTFETPQSKEERIQTATTFFQIGGIGFIIALLALCYYRVINWPMINSGIESCAYSVTTCDCSCITDVCCYCCIPAKKEQKNVQNSNISHYSHIQFSNKMKLMNGEIKENPWPFDPCPNLHPGVIYSIKNVGNRKYLDGAIRYRSELKPQLTALSENSTDYIDWRLIRTSGLTHAIKNISTDRYLERETSEILLSDKNPINNTTLQWTFWEIEDTDHIAIKNVCSGQFLDGRRVKKLSLSNADPRVQTCLQWKFIEVDRYVEDIESKDINLSEVVEEKKYDELSVPEQSKWRQWTSDDIADWILSILYSLGITKYPSNLRQLLQDEGYIGEFLDDIYPVDLMRYGFSLRDAKTVVDAIQTLIQNNSKQIKVAKNDKIDNTVIEQEEVYSDVNWREWTSDEVVDWMIVINNGQFAKYESSLRYALNDEVITGKYIGDLVEYDLQRYDVIDSRDRVALLDAIQLLITNNNYVYDDMNSDNASNVLEDSFADETEWRTWNVNQIVNWIITVDDEFIVYYSTLRKTLGYENVIGNSLTDIDMNDLERFGITSYKHQKQLLNAIKTLVNKYQNKGQTNNGYWE